MQCDGCKKKFLYSPKHDWCPSPPFLRRAFLFNFMEIWENLDLKDLDGEILENIQEFKGVYQVSNLGRVKKVTSCISKNGTTKFGSPLIMKLFKHPKNEYLAVGFRENGIKISRLVHTLVAKTFIPNIENKPQVNHKLGIKHDNRVSELEWVTPSENAIHCVNVLGKKNTTRHGSHKLGKTVFCFNNETIYVSTKEAADKLNLSQPCVAQVCRGIYESTKKYKFKYI